MVSLFFYFIFYLRDEADSTFSCKGRTARCQTGTRVKVSIFVCARVRAEPLGSRWQGCGIGVWLY